MLFDWYEKISVKFLYTLNSYLMRKNENIQNYSKKHHNVFLMLVRKAEGFDKSQNQVLREVQSTLEKVSRRNTMTDSKTTSLEAEERTGDCFVAMKLYTKAMIIF